MAFVGVTKLRVRWRRPSSVRTARSVTLTKQTRHPSVPSGAWGRVHEKDVWRLGVAYREAVMVEGVSRRA